ncbi:hypothetical protein Bca52824_017381 [Brassica carinata]|uniref:Uncharacterized protein n=1 Tax=Brassica carinata TaxID=52824 RepID=A0A8X8AVB4_BRACI|nr:hypothetical protein Bca52824_017381 [Brassica carinata]
MANNLVLLSDLQAGRSSSSVQDSDHSNLEGGDLEALGHSVNPLPSIPSSSENSVDRNLSVAVSSRFQKIRTLYLGKLSEAKDEENGLDSGVSVQEESCCNGEKFLLCMAGEGKNVRRRDVEELADFIVCEPQKDCRLAKRERTVSESEVEEDCSQKAGGEAKGLEREQKEECLNK